MNASNSPFRDGWWGTADGLSVHYRDHSGDDAATPVVCVPGLTRNARDYARLADRLAGRRRVIVIELRGRGESEWAEDPLTYVPPVYAGDVRQLLADEVRRPVAFVGTSLGGIVAMLLGAIAPDLLAGVLLNDIGPVIEPEGLDRIKTYVGAVGGWADWAGAADAMAATHGIAYPDYGPAEWMDMAERLCREKAGRIVPDYDPAIAVPFSLPAPDPAPDPWPLLAGLAGKPGLLVRGALSDILSAETAARMAGTLPELELLTVPRIGHAPTLDEPECVPAIDRWLARIDASNG